MDHAALIKPYLPPPHFAIRVPPSNPGAIDAERLTLIVDPDMNCLGIALMIFVFKNADFSGQRSLRAHQIATLPDEPLRNESSE